jgi:hypothetical protein
MSHPDWTTGFLAALEQSPNVSAACRAVGIGRRTAYDRRESDPEFARDWDDALQTAVDDLVGKTWKRADESDTLAIFLLKCHRPQVYGDRSKVELSGPDGGPMEFRKAAENVYGPDDGG